MPSAFFVSDIHIMSPQCPRAARFLELLRSLSGHSNITHLYLLGDIFDLWVADHRYFVDRYKDIIDEIRRLRNEGVDIAYFEGNHDLHLRYFWEDRLGLTVFGGPMYVRLGDTTVRLEHGDQMDPDDKGYLFLRWFLRTPPIRFLICNLPGSVIASIGDRASARSRRYTSTAKTIDAQEAVAKIQAHARKVHAEQPFDIIISGHVHVRDDSRINSEVGAFRSVNLGSWLDRPCYFKIEGADAQFHELQNSSPAQSVARLDDRVSTVQ